MSAILQSDASGLRGPADAPEYDGPSVEDLIAQKMRDPEFLAAATGLMTSDVYQPLADRNYLTFCARFLHEARKAAEDEARQEYEAARVEFANRCKPNADDPCQAIPLPKERAP